MRWAGIEQTAWTTLRARLTLWNTAAVLLMTGAALMAVWFGATAALYQEADAVLRGSAREMAIAVADLYPDVDAVIDDMRRKAAGHEERGWFTQLLTADGTTLWKSDRCPDVVADYPPKAHDRVENISQVGSYRYVRVAIATPGEQPLHVRIGMSTQFLDHNINVLVGLLATVGMTLVIVTPLAGYWLAGRATQPVADILRTAERLRPTRLGDRLPVTGTGDELDRVAITINALLDKVADHVDRQEHFVADAAHELRGPLAAIQSSLEVAMTHERSPEEQRDTLADVLDVTRHLSKLSNDLLLLAESADSSAPRGQDRVDLARLANQAVGMFAGVSEERGIALTHAGDEPVFVTGEASRLRQVISNLLDNALRFTPRGGCVMVTVVHDDAEGILTVTDNGTGIAADHLDRIFDRFYKADPARTHGEMQRSGGLGLSICRSLVEASGGSIAIASKTGSGTRVTVRLPRCAGHTAPETLAAPAGSRVAW
jgi:signal transduction histidine kinase